MAEVSAETVASISTPDRIESRLGTLEFRMGRALVRRDSCAAALYDQLDFIHGVQAVQISAFPALLLPRAPRFPLDRRRGRHHRGART